MSAPAITRRCTPTERKAFAPRNDYERFEMCAQIGEPALGTLEQRLDIIDRRIRRGRYPIRITSGEDITQYAQHTLDGE